MTLPTSLSSNLAIPLLLACFCLSVNGVDFLCQSCTAFFCHNTAQSRCPGDTYVPPDDQIMACQGPRLPQWHYDCHVYGVATTASERIYLDPVKVTDNVAGCLPGNQPSVAMQVTYSTSSSFSFSGGAKLDLKILSGFGSIFKSITEFVPGLSGGFGLTTTTTFGQAKTQTIPADYGYVSWGVFSQDAIRATVDQAIQITSTDIGGPSALYFHTYGLKVIVPIQDETTKFPSGLLAKTQRKFASVDEFRKLCGASGQLPDYLGGAPTPTPKPSPKPTTPTPGPNPTPRPSPTPVHGPTPKPQPRPTPSGRTKLQAIDNAIRVVKDGVSKGGISASIGGDLQSRLNNMKTDVVNGVTVTAAVDSAKLFVRTSGESQISTAFKARLVSALSAIGTAS